MTDNRLPDDLAALEAELRRRPRPAPAAALRGRALSAARAETARRGRWSFAASLAAAAMLLLHLMVFAAGSTNYTRVARPARLAERAEEIRAAVGDMPAAEARRLARLAAAGR